MRISDWSSDVCSSDLFEVTPRALFNTKAQSLAWNEEIQRWIVTTEEGDVFRARFIALCVGSLSQPKLPSIEGLADFKGKIFLNSRWDYDYTGGAPDNPQLTNLRDKREIGRAWCRERVCKYV